MASEAGFTFRFTSFLHRCFMRRVLAPSPKNTHRQEELACANGVSHTVS